MTDAIDTDTSATPTFDEVAAAVKLTPLPPLEWTEWGYLHDQPVPSMSARDLAALARAGVQIAGGEPA